MNKITRLKKSRIPEDDMAYSKMLEVSQETRIINPKH